LKRKTLNKGKAAASEKEEEIFSHSAWNSFSHAHFQRRLSSRPFLADCPKPSALVLPGWLQAGGFCSGCGGRRYSMLDGEIASFFSLASHVWLWQPFSTRERKNGKIRPLLRGCLQRGNGRVKGQFQSWVCKLFTRFSRLSAHNRKRHSRFHFS